MAEEGSFHDFVSKTINMPHIAAKIMNNLEPDDIAKCLKTNKDLRGFISNALQWSQQLQNGLDEEVSRMVLTSRSLLPCDSRRLERFGGVHPDYGFAYNGILWLFRNFPDFTKDMMPLTQADWNAYNEEEDLDLFVLFVYDLDVECKVEKMTKLRFQSRARPRINFLPLRSKILLQDAEKLMVFKESNATDACTRSFEILSEMEHNRWRGLTELYYPGKKFNFDADPIFDCMGLDDGRYELTLYREVDDGSIIGDAIKVDCRPKVVLKKENYLMMTSSRCITMLDTSSANIIWHKEELPESNYCQVFLTETFCGIMYKVSTNLEDAFWIETGSFMLLLFDNPTGTELYHETCWNFYRDSDLLEDPTSDYEPRVVASGNYLFACSLHGGDQDPEGNCQGNRFLCIKVDSEHKTCKVGKSTSVFENVLQVWIMESLRNFEEQDRPVDISNISVELSPDHLKLFGFILDGVVIGQVAFECEGVDGKKNIRSKTIFAVDLDKMLGMHEPSAMFAALNFPLGKDILASSAKGSGYSDVQFYPHYQPGENDQAQLSGIVEVFKEEAHLVGKSHSLTPCLEVKDLSGATK